MGEAQEDHGPGYPKILHVGFFLPKVGEELGGGEGVWTEGETGAHVALED